MKNSNDNQLKVFISRREAKCDECGEDLGAQAWITLKEEKRVTCLTCSDLDHLVFLPSGDAALTRRSRKHSQLVAVVLKWSRARKHYQRQGLLVENAALEQAERECRKYSGRVGRSAAAKELDEQAVRSAVAAHVRHTETNYDTLLSSMIERCEARNMVRDAVAVVLKQWQSGILDKC